MKLCSADCFFCFFWLFCCSRSWSCITPSCIGTTSARTTWTSRRRTTTAPGRRSSTARRGRAKTPSTPWWRSASTATALNRSGWLSTGYSTTGGCSHLHQVWQTQDSWYEAGTCFAAWVLTSSSVMSLYKRRLLFTALHVAQYGMDVGCLKGQQIHTHTYISLTLFGCFWCDVRDIGHEDDYLLSSIKALKHQTGVIGRLSPHVARVSANKLHLIGPKRQQLINQQACMFLPLAWKEIPLCWYTNCFYD